MVILPSTSLPNCSPGRVGAVINDKQHDAGDVPGTAVVAMPVEIDVANPSRLAAELYAAIKPGVTTLGIDMTRTTFCDSPA